MHVVVPAFQPGPELVPLVRALLVARPTASVLVVDDGSGPAFRPRFVEAEAAGATVLTLLENRGKGGALKAGFSLLHDLWVFDAVVTADADGQHAVEDVLRVADAVDLDPAAPPHLVVGERQFDDTTPLRSRVGNDVTRLLFRAATGQRLTDTQTGLRGFPPTLLPWLVGLRGDRYEYELVMLLEAAQRGTELRSVPIRSIYLDDNASSHFRPVADSLRIYRPLLMFAASSLSGFVVDLVAVLVLDALLGSLLLSVVGARLLSASVNYRMNRRLVFDPVGRTCARRTRRRYAILAGGLLALNWLVLSGLTHVGMPLLPAKLLTEVLLVGVSYVVQARFVFAQQGAQSDQAWHTSNR